MLEPAHRGYHLSTEQVRQLLQWGSTSRPTQLDGEDPWLLERSPTGALVEIPFPKGDEQDRGESRPVRSKSNPRSNSRTSLNQAGCVTHKAGDLGSCPLCHSPVVESAKAYSCSRWREGCGLTIWKSVAGKKITPAMFKKLLKTGETATLKGFKPKLGKKFDANLKLVGGGKVEFGF